MRHGPGDRNAVAPAGIDVRGRVGAADIGGARAGDGGVDAVRAAAAEVDDPPPLRRRDDARRLRGDEAREADLIDRERLDELRLLHRRDDLDHRLVLEERRALRHCIDVAGEAEFCQVLQDRLRKALRTQIGDVAIR